MHPGVSHSQSGLPIHARCRPALFCARIEDYCVGRWRPSAHHPGASPTRRASNIRPGRDPAGLPRRPPVRQAKRHREARSAPAKDPVDADASLRELAESRARIQLAADRSGGGSSETSTTASSSGSSPSESGSGWPRTSCAGTHEAMRSEQARNRGRRGARGNPSARAGCVSVAARRRGTRGGAACACSRCVDSHDCRRRRNRPLPA